MSAPDRLWVDWTPVDEINLPTAMSAYTPKARQAPNFIRVDYIRKDTHDATLAWAVGAAVEAVLEDVGYSLDDLDEDTQAAIRAAAGAQP